MSHSLRFLGLAVAAWVGVRALSLGLIPGAEALAFDRPAQQPGEAKAIALPPIVPTDLTPPPSAAFESTAPLGPTPYGPSYYYPAAAPYPYAAAAYPIAYRATYPAVSRSIGRSEPAYIPMRDPPSLAYYNDPVRPLDQWPLSRIASSSRPSRPIPEAASSVAPATRFDRLQLSAWAMLRGRPGASSLASNGMLGGSQAGARLTWRFNRHLAASVRTSAPVGSTTQGGEAAAGIRYQPFAGLPVALTAERRQAIGRYGGRSGFAIFAEGGVWDRPVIAGLMLDSYLQAGVVGGRRRDWFVDGSATLTRPVWRNFSGGLGVWGGAQPGLTRLDVGPRGTMRVGRSMRVHLDYRAKLLGNAQPGSGPVVTIAADF